MNSFAFDLNARRVHFTTDELLDGLRRFAAATDAPILTAKAFDAWPDRPFSARLVVPRFGSWRAALKAAGLRVGRPWSYTAQDLMTALEETWRALGRPPGKAALYRRTGLTDSPFKTRWGSIPAACEHLARFHKGQISRDELLHPTSLPPQPHPRHISPALRYQIMKRDNFRCALCGASPSTPPSRRAKQTDPIRLEIDHITPRARGGANHPDNLRTLCQTCNAGKSDD